ncbi:unnamed protein product [Vicia faba]|uniref:Uncharacterized protein n=1 Tax=Vicia faba TaxID=3906 RepID=A0AAV0ZPN5_VICFA|nr:unnamed protein product [Vicia faba]
MVGGGSRRDDGSLVINNTNVFAALDTLKKKKKSDKEKKSKGSKSGKLEAESDSKLFWALAPLNATSWGDVDDDDDDDYYATTAPPQSVWSVSEPQRSEDKQENFEETESEEDILDEGDEEEEEQDHEPEPEHDVKPEPELKKHAEVHVVPKEAERQLSRKKRKKKELEELEALLADFEVAPKESNGGQGQDKSQGASHDKKGVDGDVDGEKKEIVPESKNEKKKKKKDKASKEAKESNGQPNNSETNNRPDTCTENAEEDPSVIVEPTNEEDVPYTVLYPYMPTDLRALKRSWIQLKEERNTIREKYYEQERKILKLTRQLEEVRTINEYISTKGKRPWDF